MVKEKRELKKGVIQKSTSYMMAVPRNQFDINSIEQVIDRLKKSDTFQYLAIKNQENPTVLFRYKEKEYSVQIFLERAEFPKLYSVNHQFSKEDFDALSNAAMGVMVGFVFGESVMESFHLQIKLLNCLVPDILGIVDFSSTRIISGKWAMLVAKSEIPPAPEYLYSVHAVTSGNGKAWLHTHGLNRCGLIELEILGSRKRHYKNHYNVIMAMSNMAISKGELLEEEEAQLLMDFGKDCLVVTWVDWRYAMTLCKKNENGGIADRLHDHNEFTGVIYAYLSVADYKKKKYKHISALDRILSKNPLVMVTKEETERMKSLAMERYDTFVSQVEKAENTGIIKFGIEVDDKFKNDEFEQEHIWFEVKEINGDKIRAILTQEPYYLKDYKMNEEYIMDRNDITDWVIYMPKKMVTPDRIYLID